jgi:tryptophanase
VHAERAQLPFAEPYRVKTVETIRRTTLEERERILERASYNLFNVRAEDVFVDLLTDSGTGAMSSAQWAEMMLGDESYAGASSYYKLAEAVREILGFEHFLPTHQGRAAENVLFSTLVGVGAAGAGKIVPGNAHFDTTKGHIEARGARAVDCTIDEACDPDSDFPFKGNVDLGKLEAALDSKPRELVPLCVLTVTCNTAGGQPVSMANIRAVSELCRSRGVPLFMDAARFAENAWFIKQREPDCADRSARSIALEMLSYADGCTMSSKKDGLVNIGGLLCFRDEALMRRAMPFNIMYEGFNTYGGMAGRDMGALSVGLREATEPEYLESRIRQVALLGAALEARGVRVVRPYGGHAIFVDALRALPNVPRDEFPAQVLAVEAYREGGVRGVEIGAILADRDPATRENRYPRLELLRLALPRRTYTDNHMEYAAAVVGAVAERSDRITRGYRITREAPIMRHFTVELAPADTPAAAR